VSALRLSRPGQPTQLIDLGPQTPIALHPRGASIQERAGVIPSRRRLGEPCAVKACGRFAGHMGRHQTPERLAELAARKWV
jgi:hypothetical protein